MRFAEFKPGKLIKAGPVTLTEADIVGFATQFDPQWFHTDPDRARSGRWGGLIASGWHTCAIAMRMAVDEFLHDSESFGSPGLGKVSWRTPVRPGDTLRLEARVSGARQSSQRDDLGIVTWIWAVFNQHNEMVLEIEATSLFDLAGEDGAG